MGFMAEGLTLITMAQGIDTLLELELLGNDKVENLCKVLCWPGGLGPAAAGVALQPNHGIMVLLRTKNNLKLATYYLWYKTKTLQPLAAPGITLANVRTLQDHKDWENKHTDVE